MNINNQKALKNMINDLTRIDENPYVCHDCGIKKVQNTGKERLHVTTFHYGK